MSALDHAQIWLAHQLLKVGRCAWIGGGSVWRNARADNRTRNYRRGAAERGGGGLELLCAQFAGNSAVALRRSPTR
jgi:hypothetical protein